MDKEKRASKEISELLSWHKEQGRHDLPWRQRDESDRSRERGARHAYAVLVSEFMLQQTTVATVRPRFESWMQLFPTLESLALAEESAVLSAWQGLGYYSRARRLHAASKMIMKRHGGQIPEKKEELLLLPGIGDYTASAILAFAYDQPAAVLDTNIIRVIARWSHLTLPIDTAAGKAALSRSAEAFFHSRNPPRATATALMDLGSMICTPRQPHCDLCPLHSSCKADNPEQLPKKSPRAATTKRRENRAWVVRDGRLFLELSRGPLWNGLWILPELTSIPKGRCVAQITYPITRYRVTMKLYPVPELSETTLRGFEKMELEEIAIPSPHRRAIAAATITSHTLK